MADPVDILVENLKESFREIQRYIVLGIGSAFFFFLLMYSMPELLRKGGVVEIPGGFVPTEPRLVSLVMIVIYCISGLMTFSGIENLSLIVEKLKNHPETLEAVLTYPSVLTSSTPVVKVCAVALPPMLMILATQVKGAPPLLASWDNIAFFIFPYVLPFWAIVRFKLPSRKGKR